MKKVVFALVFAVSASYASNLQTLVCSTAQQCAQVPKTIEQLNAGRGWSGCGVVPGEKTVRVVDAQNNFVGFACVVTSEGGSL